VLLKPLAGDSCEVVVDELWASILQGEAGFQPKQLPLLYYTVNCHSPPVSASIKYSESKEKEYGSTINSIYSTNGSQSWQGVQKTGKYIGQEKYIHKYSTHYIVQLLLHYNGNGDLTNA